MYTLKLRLFTFLREEFENSKAMILEQLIYNVWVCWGGSNFGNEKKFFQVSVEKLRKLGKWILPPPVITFEYHKIEITENYNLKQKILIFFFLT